MIVLRKSSLGPRSITGAGTHSPVHALDRTKRMAMATVIATTLASVSMNAIESNFNYCWALTRAELTTESMVHQIDYFPVESTLVVSVCLPGAHTPGHSPSLGVISLEQTLSLPLATLTLGALSTDAHTPIHRASHTFSHVSLLIDLCPILWDWHCRHRPLYCQLALI